MDREHFRRLLRLGLGRAILHARDHDVSVFRDLILDACLHCYSYDVQIEGTRADYMRELVDLTPDKEFYYNEVLKALPGSGDDRDAAQRFRLAVSLAFDGNERAKRAMYESYEPGPWYGEHIGIYFLQMDGIKGLLYAAEKIGALLTSTSEKVDLGWLLGVAKDDLGEQQVLEALRGAGSENPRIEAYRLAAESAERHSDERLEQSGGTINAGYEQLKPMLREMTFTWLGSWGERASDQDLERAAHGLIAAQDPKEQFAHLRIFSQRRFPLDIQVLLKLVGVEEERVGLAALVALSQVTHPAVRELAFRLIETKDKWRREAVELLIRNFQLGDHAIVRKWFDTEEDEETLHGFGSDLMKFWKQHPDQKSEVPMLLALYERGPCSFCREHVVSWLMELNALPDDLRAECAFDSNDDIRGLLKKQTR